MFKDKQVAEKTKTSFSTKMLVSVALLIGVSVGGYLLNMAGAATTCTVDGCTVLPKMASIGLDITNTVNSATSQITTAINGGQWTYVYGPDKCSKNSVKQLFDAAANGQDIKVMRPGVFNEVMNCIKIQYLYDPNNQKDYIIKCFSSPSILGTNTFDTSETYLLYSQPNMISIDSPTCVSSGYTLEDTYNTSVSKRTIVVSNLVNNPVRWYIKK